MCTEVKLNDLDGFWNESIRGEKLTPRLGEISHWHGRQSLVEVVELSKV
jgi:hypothetical protein